VPYIYPNTFPHTGTGETLHMSQQEKSPQFEILCALLYKRKTHARMHARTHMLTYSTNQRAQPSIRKVQFITLLNIITNRPLFYVNSPIACHPSSSTHYPNLAIKKMTPKINLNDVR